MKKSFEYNDIGRIALHCYLIKNGVRAGASETIRKENLDSALQDIADDELYCFHSPQGDTHVHICIFKHKHVEDIIKRIYKCQDDILSTWCFGKLFGYSEQSIGQCLDYGEEKEPV